MSIKSLLQLIILLLIFIIIGGIYFLYFYSGPLKTKELSNNLNINKSEIDPGRTSNQEILEEISPEVNKNLKNTKLDEDDQVNKTKSKEFLKVENDEKVKNYTKDIEYITSNEKGDILKILASYGKTNSKNSNILNLKDVRGLISSSFRPDIKISSEYAEYDYSNQNSKFYKNVEIKYNNKIIRCDNLDLNIKSNIAVGYNNVTLQDGSSFMKAQKITMNIKTKDININSEDEVKIKSN